MNFDNKEFGQRIRALRKQHKMSQIELCDELGISVSHLSKIELGLANPSVDMLLLFSDYFNASTDFLLKGKDFSNENLKNDMKTAIDLLVQSYNKL